MFLAVIAALHQHIRLYPPQQTLGGVIGKSYHPIHGLQPGKHRHTTIQRVNRAASAFEFANGSIGIDSHDQTITLFARLLQVANMAGVDDVETAVGKYNTFPRGTCILQRQQ